MSCRNAGILLVMLGLVVVSAQAQESGESRASVHAGLFAMTHSEGRGTQVDGGVGLSLMHYFSPTFSAELTAGMEQHETSVESFVDGARTVEKRRTTWHPFDLMAQYHFANSVLWKPYVAAGLRYTDAPGQTEVAPQIGAGVLFRMTPRVALRFDVRQALGNADGGPVPETRPYAGLSWRFGR